MDMGGLRGGSWPVKGVILVGTLLRAFGTTVVRAQTEAAPEFEVVSIRPCPPGTRWNYQVLHDTMELTGANARVLVADAYGFDLPNVVGGPAWVNSTGYDLTAKFDELLAAKLAVLSPQERMDRILVMLRPVMAERFGLKVHKETRETKVYDLVVAKGGPKFSPATSTQGVVDQHEVQASYNGHLWTANREPMSFLALQLSRIPAVGRNVVDQTGLKGDYKFTFDWSARTDADVSVFTAVEEQLGLKLEPAKGSVEVLAIDHIDLPSDN